MNSKITLELIKELRAHTGIGIDKCKKALQESNGDIDLAITNLRKAGMASAVKKEGREAKEGLVCHFENNNVIAIVEINAETDFVVKNETFQEFAKNIAKEIAETAPENLDSFLKQKYSQDNALSIDEYRASIIHSLGENIQIKRFKTIRKEENESFGVYSHMDGKIVAVVELLGSNSESVLAKDIAMHTAAEMPLFLSTDEIDDEIKQKEREIAKSQIQDKPENIQDKIVEGKLNAFYDQTCLLRQKFVKDSNITIEKLLEQHSKEKSVSLSIKNFLRWKVGE